MQNIPYTNLEEKPVWPNLTLSGEDIHNAYCRIEPDESRPWGSLNLVAQRRYGALAKELNRELDARQAWFEGEDRAISAIKCPSCDILADAAHFKAHAIIEGNG